MDPWYKTADFNVVSEEHNKNGNMKDGLEEPGSWFPSAVWRRTILSPTFWFNHVWSLAHERYHLSWVYNL